MILHSPYLQGGNQMKLSIKGKETMWAYIFIGVPLLFFICIRILPTLFTFNLSFREWTILAPDKPYVFLKNFSDMMQDEVFWTVLKNTVIYVVVSVPVGLLISLGIALMLNRIRKGESFYRMLVFIPYVTPVVATAWVWRWLFMKHGGAVNSIIGLLGIPQQPFLDSTTQAIFVVCSNIVWQNMGFYTVIFLAGLKQISKTYYEAAAIDGATPWMQFRKITIPLLNPTVVYLVVMATIQTLQVFTQVFNITAGGQGNPGGPLNSTLSIVLYVYQLGFKSYNMGYASAVTVVLFMIILLITILQMKVLTRKMDY
jgi:multiple sugar transport system permease protein